MKKTFLLLAAFCLFATTANAYTFDETDHKFLTLATYAMIDYQQSCEMFFERDGFKEVNPILGDHPTRASLMGFGIGSLALAYGVTKLLPENRFKTILVDSILATEQLNIEENREVMRYRNPKYNRLMVVMKVNF